jgi:hypothetical protein
MLGYVMLRSSSINFFTMFTMVVLMLVIQTTNTQAAKLYNEGDFPIWLYSLNNEGDLGPIGPGEALDGIEWKKTKKCVISLAQSGTISAAERQVGAKWAAVCDLESAQMKGKTTARGMAKR